MRLSVSLFFLVGLLFSKPSQSAPPLFDETSRTPQKGVWDFQFQTNYYQAYANYSPAGNVYNELPSGASYNLLQIDFGARWVPVSKWGIYTTSQVANAESQSEGQTRTNSSLTHMVIGTDYQLVTKKTVTLTPDFSVLVPFSRVDATADEVLNHEGAVEVTGRLIGKLHFGRVRPFAFAGFTYRDEDRSSLLPYGVGTEIQFSKWSIGAELRGFHTVIKDKYTDDANKREIVATKNGQSLRFFSVDPSLLESNAWIRSQIGNSWEFKLGGGASLTGASISAGWTVFGALSYSFQGKGSSAPEYVPETGPSRFQEETNDGVDQELFQIKPTAPPPPPPSKEQQRKNLQKDLDNTEFQIELKREKTKKKSRP